MGLFRRKRDTVDSVEIKADSVNITEASPATKTSDPIVEIIANDTAKKEVIEQAKKASNKLNELLVQNGFTIKIYLAAGHNPTSRKGKKTND